VLLPPGSGGQLSHKNTDELAEQTNKIRLKANERFSTTKLLINVLGFRGLFLFSTAGVLQ